MHRQQPVEDETGFTHTIEVAEVTEFNVEEIGIESPDLDGEILYEPVDGVVKWFRDELHQLWVKFVVELMDGNLKSLVIPANKVNFVQYPKNRN